MFRGAVDDCTDLVSLVHCLVYFPKILPLIEMTHIDLVLMSSSKKSLNLDNDETTAHVWADGCANEVVDENDQAGDLGSAIVEC